MMAIWANDRQRNY